MIAQNFDPEIIVLRDARTRSPGFFKPPKADISASTSCTPDPQPNSRYSARVFPNGEFGVGYNPPMRISAQDRRHERERRYAEDNAEIKTVMKLDDDGNIVYYGRERELAPPPPLSLGIGAESSQRRKYGMRGITSHGRKMLRNAGTLLDKQCENQYNRRMQMGTLTVPSYTEEGMKAICMNWHNIVRRFFQECKRRYAKFRYRFDYASCTEIQPKRWENRREVGLHLHFLFIAIRMGRGKWALPDNWVREVWQRILESYLGRGEVLQQPNYDRATVHSSSAGYVAKYASKGAEYVEQVIEEKGEEWVPSQWWSISSTLRSAIYACVIKSTGVVAEMLLHICHDGIEEYLRYVRKITLKHELNDHARERNCPEEFLLGYGGMLTSGGHRLFYPNGIMQQVRTLLPRTLGKKCKPFTTKTRRKQCQSTRKTLMILT